MPVSNRSNVYAVSIGGTMLGGVTRQALTSGTSMIGDASDGELYARIKAIAGQAPAGSFDTTAIAAGLNALPALGYDIASGSGVVIYGQLHEDGGTRAGATSHKSYSMAAGMVVPRRLACDHQGNASLSYDVIASWNQSVDPLVIAESVTLPAAPGINERFTLGPMTIGGVALEGRRGFEIDFGNNMSVEGSDSDLWPTHVSVGTHMPVLRLRGIDISWFADANIPLLGQNAIHTDTDIYLRKRADGGTYVDDLTAEHIHFTADGMAYVSQIFDGTSGSDPAEVALEFPLRFDGTNPPLVVDTAAAIP